MHNYLKVIQCINPFELFLFLKCVIWFGKKPDRNYITSMKTLFPTRNPKAGVSVSSQEWTYLSYCGLNPALVHTITKHKQFSYCIRLIILTCKLHC